MKLCKQCQKILSISEFQRSKIAKDGLRRECRICNTKQVNAYRQKHRERYRLKQKEYQNRYLDKKFKRTPVIIKGALNTNDYDKRRKQIDPGFRLAKNLRSRVNRAVRTYKAGSAIKNLGCTVAELKTYLETKFQPDMTWENYGKWHIDHIVPLSAFDLSNSAEFILACHYSNLQPLWATDNRKKSANY